MKMKANRNPVLVLPELNGLNPTLESTYIKLGEEMGEVARVLGKGRCMNGEVESERLSDIAFVSELGSELFDVAQSAVTMLYLLHNKYNLDISKFQFKHINKLRQKGYLLSMDGESMLDKIYDELGNIVNLAIPDYDIITKDDDKIIVEAKKEIQCRLWDSIYNVYTEGDGNDDKIC